MTSHKATAFKICTTRNGVSALVQLSQVSGVFLQTAQTWANAGGVLLSRISEFTIGCTFSPFVGSFTSPGIDTRKKGPPAFSVSSERHRQMWRERNCISFETAVGGIEPQSGALPRDHRSSE